MHSLPLSRRPVGDFHTHTQQRIHLLSYCLFNFLVPPPLLFLLLALCRLSWCLDTRLLKLRFVLSHHVSFIVSPFKHLSLFPPYMVAYSYQHFTSKRYSLALCFPTNTLQFLTSFNRQRLTINISIFVLLFPLPRVT